MEFRVIGIQFAHKEDAQDYTGVNTECKIVTLVGEDKHTIMVIPMFILNASFVNLGDIFRIHFKKVND